jgi:phosphatidylserine/phosphatidylglycerophosphate/cardiolipin synthase-like enzyme
VVLLGIDLAEAKRPGCLGFAIQREDHTENEVYWLQGMKTFQDTDPLLGPGGQVSSRQHPFQTFQWADYSAKPGYDYTYNILPLYGKPEALVEGDAVGIRISTEASAGATHSVYFNRGAVASQEYARRFDNLAPSKVGPPAYKWLSRGLFEAFVEFVSRANGPEYQLFGAFYEFQWPEALKAIGTAAASGARVRIVYDGIANRSGPSEKNQEAIATARIKTLCAARTTGKIMHNKFVVLKKNDKPVAVWTGSTNLTENGIFGHLNCGHVIEDPEVAASYLSYWDELKDDPDIATEKTWIAENNAAPPDPWDSDSTVVLSPRPGLSVLQWYSQIADSAKSGLFMTFAFGMHKFFQDVYEQNDNVLRFALMEKEGNGAGLAQAKLIIQRIRQLPNVVIAIGKYITENSFDRWLKERRSLSSESHVNYVHTKFMIVDPLGDTPVVVTGSANFSAASTNANDENMVVIRGDKRVADIYLSEFIRSFSHYAFREAVANWRENHPDEEWTPNYLVPNDSWQKDYFTPGDSRDARRRYFSGS